jgi:hypothetical protein
VGFTTIGHNKLNNLAGKINVGRRLLDVVKYRSAGIGEGCDSLVANHIQSEIERELKVAAHSRDTPDDVGTVNGAAIPSVSGNHSSFDPNEWCGAVGTSNSDGFVQVLKETLDTDGFVVASGSAVQSNAEKLTSFRKDAAKSAASISNNESAHVDFQQDFLEQKTGKVMGMSSLDGNTDHELGEVAHGRKEMGVTGSRYSSAGTPEVAIEDLEERANHV